MNIAIAKRPKVKGVSCQMMAKYIEMESCRARRQTIDNGRRARGERRPSGRRGARRPDPRPLTRRPRARRVDREGGRARHDRHRNPRRFGNPMYLTRDMVKATSGKLCNLHTRQLGILLLSSQNVDSSQIANIFRLLLHEVPPRVDIVQLYGMHSWRENN